MPAPTNTTMATATDIGTLTGTTATTVTQDAYFSGDAYDLWYFYDPVAGDRVIGVFGIGISASAGYRPTVSVWVNLAVPENFLNIVALQVPLQTPVSVGTRIYFKAVDTFNTNTNPSVLTLRIVRAPDVTLAAGQLAINDSTTGFPAVIMNASTAAPTAYRNGFAAGEGVAVLTNGVVAVIDSDGDGVVLYNADLTERVTPTMPSTGYNDCIGTNQVDTFWVGKNGGGAVHGFMVRMDQLGAFGTPLDLASAGLASLSPNAANTIVYYTKTASVANTAVLQVTYPGGVITTFLAGVANYFFGANLMMLTDDTLLVPYERSTFASVIKRYDTSAVLLNTYTLAVDAGLERIFADPADPAYFWIWTQTSTTSTFTKIKVSDGSTTVVGPWPKFVEGVSQPAASLTPTAYFGADFSCVPWILRGATNPTTTTYTIRRQRRFLAPSSPDNKTMQMPVLELLMRTGIGLTPTDSWGGSLPLGVDPQVMIRVSRDGGTTWGPERWVSAGRLGKFAERVRLTRFSGNYRNMVIEVTVDAPVDWGFLAALAPNGITEGNS